MAEPSQDPDAHLAITDILGGPIGEPCQEISRFEARELSRFIQEALERRGLVIQALPSASAAPAPQ